jgi:hypothetical protein
VLKGSSNLTFDEDVGDRCFAVTFMSAVRVSLLSIINLSVLLINLVVVTYSVIKLTLTYFRSVRMDRSAQGCW